PPQLLTGLEIEAANVAGNSVASLLARRRRENRNVLEDRRRRGDVVAAAELFGHADLEIDVALLANPNELAVFRVDLRQQSVGGRGHEARGSLRVAGPIGNAARRVAAGR